MSSTPQDDLYATALNTAARARTERQLAMLEELARMGMDLARAVHAQAMSAEGQAPGASNAASLALTYARIARAVRQTVALEAKLGEERHHVNLALHGLKVQREDAAKRQRTLRQQRQIDRILGEIIDDDNDPDETEELLLDLRRELNEDPDQAGHSVQEIGEIVEGVCRSLGMAFDPALWGLPAEGNQVANAPMPPSATAAELVARINRTMMRRHRQAGIPPP